MSCEHDWDSGAYGYRQHCTKCRILYYDWLEAERDRYKQVIDKAIGFFKTGVDLGHWYDASVVVEHLKRWKAEIESTDTSTFQGDGK